MIELLLDPSPDSHLIYADWLEEHGEESWIVEAWRSGVTAFRGFYLSSGSGRGSGRGVGVGIGVGRGVGGGSGVGNHTEETMQPGQNYLVHGGDWHTFVGRCVRQVGPLLYEFERVSKIRDTNNGDCWHELAAGNEEKRRAAEYVHHSTATYLPVSVAAFKWVGKLPQED